MSDLPTARPAGQPYGPFYPPRRRSFLVLFLLSFFFNLVFVVILGLGCLGLFLGDPATTPLREKHYSGQSTARNKIAIVEVDGVLLEGLLTFVEKEIDQAADDRVKAVVLRINSPGGSITASDDLYRRITLLRDGNPAKKTSGKPLVVSMAGVAASGAYYIAMPVKTLYAERTTLTGSIGVYVALPNVKELTDKYGFKMEVIKRGAVKYSGSPFAELKPEEREMWQEMVDHSYSQFKSVIEQGRPQLAGKLDEKVINEPREVTVEENGKSIQKKIQYVRQRADGGTFTADQAKAFGLIDKIGYLDDAIADAHDQAGPGTDYQAIKYERPHALSDLLFGAKAAPPASALDAAKLAQGLTPRLWYLAPQSDLAGLAAAGAR
jgi:protease-4